MNFYGASYVSKTQSFRRRRSTTHALFVVRRFQDIGEQTGDRLITTMLDWEKKTFDQISHSRRMQALERLNIPQFPSKHEHFTSEKRCRMLGSAKVAHSHLVCLSFWWQWCSRTSHLKHHRELTPAGQIKFHVVNFCMQMTQFSFPKPLGVWIDCCTP